MDEKVKTSPVFHSKDFNSYDNTEDNFVDNQELTLTITLNEYRKLLQKAANAERDSAQHDLYDAQTEIGKLKERNSILLEQLQKKPAAGATATDTKQS